MFSTFFAWLRRKSAEAILAGAQDAATELDAQDDSRELSEAFRERLALPAPEETAVKNGKARK